MALERYKMRYMEKIPFDAPEAAAGAERRDTRKHTKHCLRPTTEIVESYQVGELSWDEFAEKYRVILEGRFVENRTPFDELAELAYSHDVFIGCSCPTKSNPKVAHCHTVLALDFMQKKYPALVVKFPEETI